MGGGCRPRRLSGHGENALAYRNATAVDALWPRQPVNLQPRMRSHGNAQTKLALGGAPMIGLLITIILIIIVLRLLF